MKISETKIPKCYVITPNILKDERGSFIKTFHQEIFQRYKLKTKFAEEYYSVIRRCKNKLNQITQL